MWGWGRGSDQKLTQGLSALIIQIHKCYTAYYYCVPHSPKNCNDFNGVWIKRSSYVLLPIWVRQQLYPMIWSCCLLPTLRLILVLTFSAKVFFFSFGKTPWIASSSATIINDTMTGNLTPKESSCCSDKAILPMPWLLENKQG